MLRKLAVLLLFHSVSQVFLGQSNPTAVTNSDLIKMANAGIGDQTIILAVQRGPTMLDTSPQALVLLKKAGVSDQALNAILAATKSQDQLLTQPSQSASTSSPVSPDAEQKDEHRRYQPPENPRSGSRWHLWRSKL
jgi:hypothetical protein